MPERVCSKAWAISAELCIKLAWLSTTPLGVPVEPEVYCRKAKVSPWTSGMSHFSSVPAGTWQVASHVSCFKCGVSSISGSTRFEHGVGRQGDLRVGVVGDGLDPVQANDSAAADRPARRSRRRTSSRKRRR